MTSTNNLAFTAPINPAGATPHLSLDQIWSGLLLKIRSAETFVPAAIQSTKVVDEYIDPATGNPVTVREVTFRETQKIVKETVTAFKPCRVEFAQPDGSRVSNVISQGADGELFMTYIFEWRHPGASEKELAELLGKEKKMSQMAVEGTIKPTHGFKAIAYIEILLDLRDSFDLIGSTRDGMPMKEALSPYRLSFFTLIKTYTRASSSLTTQLQTYTQTLIMLEARLEQASLLKRVVDAIKDLVQDCNFDCNDSGIALQAMDNSHVALVSMLLRAEGFSPYRCDRNIALGINLLSLTKVLRAAQNEDILTLKAEDSPDAVNLMFESAETDRLSEYDIKLMDIDQEHLAIPETEYAATVKMPSGEFQRICRDLNQLSESVVIEASKEGVKFSCQGDIGNGSVTIRQHTNVENPEKNVTIDLSEPVALTFSLKYLVNFCKASNLSTFVELHLSAEVPLLVEYGLGSGHLRFYLAPKIGDEE
ncbi:uncharacterized protein N7515_001445 [Penicillium bovifimosum]|uniref:DNA sliding clamp PCNA n=1 Tax=Penicillium bovifimosum TaxID=126998 RepID=A0A9W9HBL0_9EURO|nr:uncharacterized protein N7515_001445 [Penicillium bovifimosum]KAJ5142658.1 hypothetical protein N7515_001445 [Penicillium bovifimosum]